MQLNTSARQVFVASGASKTRFPSLLNLLVPSCSTKRGRQCLKEWLGCPCVDSDVLNERLDTVDTIVSAVADGHPLLRKLSSLFQHIQGYGRELSLFTSSEPGKADSSVDKKLSLSDFSGFEKWTRELLVLVENCLVGAEFAPRLDNLFSVRLQPIQQLCAGNLQPFCDLVREMIGGRNGGLHLPYNCKSYALKFDSAATLLCIAEDRIKVVYADDEQSNIARMGIVLRVSRQDSHCIQQQNGKGLSLIRAKWKSLKRNYEDAEANLVNFLISEFQTHFQEFLDDLARRVAELDVLVSFSLVSNKHKFVRASTSDCSTLRLYGIFDPFLQSTRDTNGESSRTMTIEFSSHEGKTFLLLNGDQEPTDTNLLQLLGTVVVLNQLGCFVPSKEALLPVFDAIYLRTGAYDQQLYGYSTFMTEMREMKHISRR